MPKKGFKHPEDCKHCEWVRNRPKEEHPMYGKQHTKEAKELQRQAKLGFVPTPEHIEKIKKANVGNKYTKGKHTQTKESKRAIGDAQLGNKHSIGNQNAKGYKHTLEAKLSMHLSHINVPLSQEHRQNLPRGEKHPNWKGGRSTFVYSVEWTGLLREQIRQRDNYQCQSCFRHQSEFKRKLHVHHIDEDKKNCSEENLISLCNSCHIKGHRIKNKKYLELYSLLK